MEMEWNCWDFTEENFRL